MNFFYIKDLNYENILKNVSINFKRNKVNYISGSNKCGKTTLIKILSGIIESSNSVFYDNKDISLLTSNEISSIISTVILPLKIEFDFPTLNQELQFRFDKIDNNRQNLMKRYKDLVRLFELEDYLFSDINELSLATKIKILIIRELLVCPKILILDNIFDELDIYVSKDIINKLKTLDDLTIIMSSNNLDLVLESDYLYILNKSALLFSGETKEVLKEDSSLNKIGLELPFMVDLSLKLKYYDLLEDIELDVDRMVDILWK